MGVFGYLSFRGGFKKESALSRRFLSSWGYQVPVPNVHEAVVMTQLTVAPVPFFGVIVMAVLFICESALGHVVPVWQAVGFHPGGVISAVNAAAKAFACADASPRQALSADFLRYSWYAGNATAARMPIIATTIISSMSVKPCWTRFMMNLQ